jgi:hypothetical protein
MRRNNNNNNNSDRTYLPDGRSFIPDDRRVAFGRSQFLTDGPDKNRYIDTFKHGNNTSARSSGPRDNTYGSNGRPAYTTDPRNPHVYSLDEYGNTIYNNNPVYFTGEDEEEMKYNGQYDAWAAKAEGARMRNTQYNSLIGTPDDPDEPKSCWDMLLECLTGSKSNRGGGYMSGDVTIEDLRSFLDSNPDIKNILLNDQCPLNPSDQMKTNIQTFMGMLESYGKEITIAQIYGRGGRKRRSKKTKKPKRRRTRRTRKH